MGSYLKSALKAVVEDMQRALANFKKSSHFNIYSLEITDPEIAQQFLASQSNRNNWLFYFISLIALIHLLLTTPELVKLKGR